MNKKVINVTEAQLKLLRQMFELEPKDTIVEATKKLVAMATSADEEQRALKAQIATEQHPMLRMILLIRRNAAIQTYLDSHDVLMALDELLKEIKAKQEAAA